MPVFTVADAENGKTDLDDLASIVNGSTTVTTRYGGDKLSVSQALSRITIGDISTYSAASTYTEITDWVEESGIVYRPLPSALPIGPEAFDSANWIVVQGLTRNDKIHPPVADYTELRGLISSTLVDGTIINVTNEGVASNFVVKTGTVTDNGGTLLTFDDDPTNRYAQAITRETGEYFVDQFGSDFDTAFSELVNYLRLVENSSSSSGGRIRLNHAAYTTDGDLNLYNDMEVIGYNFASRITLSNGAESDVILFQDTNKSRIKFDRFWIDGNASNQVGTFRGINYGAFEAYQWEIGSIHIHNCGGAGFYGLTGTSFQFNKLDVSFCGANGTEAACVLPEQSIGSEVSITGVDDTNYTIIGLSVGGANGILHAHFENTRHIEFRGDGSTVDTVFANGELACIFHGSSNKILNASNTDSSNNLRISIQDNSTHNEVPFNSVWNNHNTLRVLHPGDGVNPYFLDGEDQWTGVARVRPSQAFGTETINIPVPIAMQPNGNTATKTIPVESSTDYLVETFYGGTNDGNTMDIVINDGTSDVLDSGSLTSFDESKKWEKFIGVARMGGSATQATYSIESAGTNEDGYANAFTGARVTKSEVDNGSMEGGFTSGVANNWTSSGTGTFTQETGASNVRHGTSSQKIVVTGSNEAKFTSDNMSNLRSGVSYVLGGFVKIESTDNNKPLKLWYNTGNERFSQVMCAQTNLQNPNTDWQAFQFIIDYDDQGGATNSLVIEVRGDTTVYVDDVYCIPLVRQGLEAPKRMCIETPMDLSGGVDTRFIHAASERTPLYLSHANVMYTEASSADPGIDIEIGKYRLGDLDLDFFGSYTTDTSVGLYDTRQFFFDRHIARDESSIGIRSNGGKTGAGTVIVEVVACDL